MSTPLRSDAAVPNAPSAAKSAAPPISAVKTVARARHPVFDLLGRYGAIFGAAWGQRHEMAGPRRRADEAAFLPAALSLQETPPHPLPRRAMWIIMALFASALGWSVLGQVDIVAVAQGRIVVSDRTKLVQPLEAGVVKAIHVQDGDRVSAGQVLVELDATVAGADRLNVQEQLQAAHSDVVRSTALLEAVRTGKRPTLDAVGDDGKSESDAQLLQAEWTDITSKLSRYDLDAARREAELETNRAVLSKLQTTLPLAKRREEDFKSLSAQGFVAGHAGQDRTRQRIEMELDLKTQRARVAEVQASLAESRNSRVAYVAEMQRTLSDRLSQAQLKEAQLTQESAKTTQRERLTQLTAPVSGAVQQLAIHTAGGVVTPAQVLMVIVPDGAEVTAEVSVDNKDIGFIAAGQVAEIKLETFSFTRYGTVPATVTRVTADAVTDEKRGAVFPATLRLARGEIDVDGKLIKLAPGMNLTAEVKTGKRRVIDFLLSPLKQATSESLKER